MKRWIAGMLAASIVLSMGGVVALAEEATTAGETASAAEEQQTSTAADTQSGGQDDNAVVYEPSRTYRDYLEELGNVASGTGTYVLEPSSITSRTDGVRILDNYDGTTGQSVYTGEEDTIEYTFEVDQPGLYNLQFLYHTEDGKSVSMERALYINGEVPFSNAETLTFTRIWKDDYPNADKSFAKDAYGNDIRPTQVEELGWNEIYACDYLGYETAPLQFYFQQGTNTIRLESVKEPMTIKEIRVLPVQQLKSYEEVKAEYQQNGYTNYEGEELIVEAESAVRKSDQTLYPSADFSSPATSPTEDYKQLINMVGGSRWQYAQQAVTWEVEAPAAGLYSINIKARKNLYQGMLSCRKLYINGEVPFQEAEAISFTYDKDWVLVSPTTEDGEECLVYLNAGTNEITLEVTQGETGSYVQQAMNVLTELNDIYRSIIMITGVEPDKYRDYQLDELMPEVIENMKVQADTLQSVVDGIVAQSGQKGSDLATAETLAQQLNDFYNDPDEIPKRLALFKTNIGSLGTWLNTAGYAPLEIDYISFSQPDSDIQPANRNFFVNLWYSVNQFIGSFVIDYNAIGSMTTQTDEDQTIEVWMSAGTVAGNGGQSAGRDQFQTLRSMINDQYTKETGNEVELSLVNVGVLLSAVVAGIGPDVSLGVARTEPVNYAIRGAAVDLTQFEDFNEVSKRFSEQALVSSTYDDGQHVGVYGLPETQTFQVLFYRKDVLAELGLSIPETWDDVINCITVLNKNSLEFGLPVSTTLDPNGGILTFYSLLLQNGGTLYLDDQTGVNLYNENATVAFKEWTNFYTNYDLPLTYDFQNRFRTGEMPLGISGYTLYNTLSVAAPEINGLWDFTSVPGTVQEDGSIDHSNALDVTYTIILGDTDKKELSWEFLKWWSSADTQTQYGTELECILGPAARYNTANLEAFERLPWTTDEINSLEGQLENAYALPQIPGSYFLTRHINNAFYKVRYAGTDPKDTLTDYAKTIDAEITKKRQEFGLPTAED